MRKLLAIATMGLSLTGCTKGASPRVVNLAIWSNYVTPEFLKAFEAAKGIHVEVSNFSTNEELLAKLQAGASGYDLIVPSDYMVYAMDKLGLLRPLDYAKIPNARSLDPKWMGKPYDPKNRFSVPFDWGTTGIAVNHTLYKKPIRSWKDLFDNPELAGKFSILDDSREAIGAALKMLGYSLNTRDPKEIEKAKKVLIAARARAKAFNSEPLMPLVNGEFAVAHAYSTDTAQADVQTGGKIDFVIPREGGTLWIDNLAIPQSAQHPEEAYALLNYLLEPKSNFGTVTSIFVGPANKDTLAMLPQDFLRNTAVFPPASALEHCEMIADVGASLALWDRAWTEVKAAGQ